MEKINELNVLPIKRFMSDIYFSPILMSFKENNAIEASLQILVTLKKVRTFLKNNEHLYRYYHALNFTIFQLNNLEVSSIVLSPNVLSSIVQGVLKKAFIWIQTH